jgi:hypothetical protein
VMFGMFSIFPFVFAQFLQNEFNQDLSKKETEVKTSFQEVAARISQTFPTRSAETHLMMELRNFQIEVNQKFSGINEKNSELKEELSQKIKNETSQVSEIVHHTQKNLESSILTHLKQELLSNLTMETSSLQEHGERIVFAISQINPMLKNFESAVVVNLEHMEEQIKTLADNVVVLDTAAKDFAYEAKIDIIQAIQNGSADVVMDVAGEMKQVIQKLKDMNQAEWKSQVGESSLRTLLKQNFDIVRESAERISHKQSKKLVDELLQLRVQMEESLSSLGTDLQTSKQDVLSSLTSEFESIRFNFDSSQELFSNSMEHIRSLLNQVSQKSQSIEASLESNAALMRNLSAQDYEKYQNLGLELKEMNALNMDVLIPQFERMAQLQQEFSNDFKLLPRQQKRAYAKSMERLEEQFNTLAQKSELLFEKESQMSLQKLQSHQKKIDIFLSKVESVIQVIEKDAAEKKKELFSLAKGMEKNIHNFTENVENTQKLILDEVQSVCDYLEEVPISSLHVIQKPSRKRASARVRDIKDSAS